MLSLLTMQKIRYPFATSKYLGNIMLGFQYSVNSREPSKPFISDYLTVISERASYFNPSFYSLNDSCISEKACKIQLITEINNILEPSIAEYYRKLEEIKNLPNDWNGLGSISPNEIAAQNSYALLNVLDEKDFTPQQIGPSVNEGIAISFVKDSKYAIITCYNDGEIFVSTFREMGEPDIVQIKDSYSDLKDAVDRVYAFING